MRRGRAALMAMAAISLATVHGYGGEERHEVGIGAGGGRYWYSGCNTPRHEGGFGELQVWYRRQSRKGPSVAVEASVVHARETDTTIPTTASRSRLAKMAAARVGYHFAYAGAEAGLAGVDDLRVGDDVLTRFLPSARIWVGSPRTLYLFGSLLAEESRGQDRILAIGLGHASPRLRLALGVGGSQGTSETVVMNLETRIATSLWLGARLSGLDRQTWSGLATMSFDIGADSPRPPAAEASR